MAVRAQLFPPFVLGDFLTTLLLEIAHVVSFNTALFRHYHFPPEALYFP